MKISKDTIKLIGGFAITIGMAILSKKSELDDERTIKNLTDRVSELEGLLKKES